MAHSEHFLDDYGLDHLGGVSRSVNSPTKYASNPVFGDASWTWDKEVNYCMPQLIGGTLNLWYTGFDSVPTPHTCKATSADGITFSRPTVGTHSYSGSTSNNLVLAANTHSGGVHYDSTLSPAYYLASESKAGESAYGCYLWTSTDGTSWTAAKTIYQSANNGDYREGRQIVQRSDGRWLFYYIHNGTAQRRQVGAFLSATSDVTGSWSDLGVLIDSQSQDSQIYHFHEMAVGGLRLGVCCNYNRTTEQMDQLRLYTSRDHRTWHLLTDDWLSIGSAAQWDDEMIIPSLPLVRFANDWRLYYAGFAEDHATYPRNARIGYAHIGYGRIGGVGTTGYVRTKAITVGAAEALTVNANAAGGSIKAQLIDATTGNPVPNYTATESSTISSDTYSTEITWGGNSIPAGTYKIRFDLTDATLHSFEVA